MPNVLMSDVCYQFSMIEKIADCEKFNAVMDMLVSYMKLTTDDAEFVQDNVFDWMAMVDTGDYDDVEIKDDITERGSWNENDINYIKKALRELNRLMNDVLNDFEQKTGVRVYFKYNDEEYESYFDFSANTVFEALLKTYVKEDKNVSI